MDDEPDPGDDVSSFRLPPIGLGKCLIGSRRNLSEGCQACVDTHYNNFVRVSEDGQEYVLNGCLRYDMMQTWRTVKDELGISVNEMQGRRQYMTTYQAWVLEKMEGLLSAYDTAHTRRGQLDMPLETFLASQ